MTTPTPLTRADALHALYELIGDHALVAAVVAAFGTWEALAAATPAELGRRVGPWAAQLRVPERCPRLPGLGSQVVATTRYQAGYPAGLGDLEDPPAVLYSLGTLPKGPYLAVGGSYYPTAAGLSATQATATAAADLGVPVVASVDPGCGQVAITAALAAGGTVVGVVSCDLALPATAAGLLAEIVAGGGAVVSEWGPGEIWSESHTFASTRLVAALGRAVVLCELGTHPAGGAHLAQAAISARRFLIVPAPNSDLLLPVGSAGTATLARARSFSEEPFGSSPHLSARVAAGHTPADAVVSTPAQLCAAIAAVCCRTARHAEVRRTTKAARRRSRPAAS